MKITVPLPREIAQKLRVKLFSKNMKFRVDEVTCTALHLHTVNDAMPNQHAADKETLSFYVPRALALRLRKEAARRGESMTQFLTAIFTHATEHIELTPEDYRSIADAVEKAQKSGKRRATKLPHPPST